jgi:hypothetical protein
MTRLVIGVVMVVVGCSSRERPSDGCGMDGHCICASIPAPVPEIKKP